MDSLILTQLSVLEIREIFRQELEIFFASKSTEVATSENEDQLFSIEQASKFLNLARSSIYGMVSRSQIPVCKRGKRLYFSKKELREWIKQGRRKTLTEIADEVHACLPVKNKAGIRDISSRSKTGKAA